MTILYPVAANADQALSRPLGRAAREREAAAVAGEPVCFLTQSVGPGFATREAALAAYRDRVEGAEPDQRYCQLVERIAAEPGKPDSLATVKPTFQDGRRWPAPPASAPRTVWRLMVSYWRPGSAATAEEAPQARVARKAGAEVDAETLRAIARTPLRPVTPQQPLDIGLFETRLPEAPHIVVPDE
jgi:hypothetical protein